MPATRQIRSRLKAIARWAWDHYVPIFMAYLPLQALVNFAVHWDRPDYGFRQFGPGVFLTCLFPAIWLLIYVFCGVIARRNRLVADLRRQLDNAATPPGATPREGQQ